MDINASAWIVTVLLVQHVWSWPNSKYLKICVIDALKDKRWCSGLQREDNTELNRGEQQVGGAHYHCMDTSTHTRTETHSRLHSWLTWRRATKWQQVLDSPPGLWLCPPAGWCWFPLAGFQGFWFPVWFSSSWQAVDWKCIITVNNIYMWQKWE